MGGEAGLEDWERLVADRREGWDRFLAVEGSTWDVVVETGMGDPTKAEEKAILDLGYYGETINRKTVEGLKAGKRFKAPSRYRMRVSHPDEPGVRERSFKTKKALLKAAREMGGGEAGPQDTSWVNDVGSRIEVAGATYGEIFPGPALSTNEGYVMILRSVGNPDLGQYAPVSEPSAVKGKTLAAMVKAAEEYRDFWDLGSGNWVDPEIRTAKGRKVGRISYNGRIWGSDGKEIIP